MINGVDIPASGKSVIGAADGVGVGLTDAFGEGETSIVPCADGVGTTDATGDADATGVGTGLAIGEGLNTGDGIIDGIGDAIGVGLGGQTPEYQTRYPLKTLDESYTSSCTV